MHRVTMVIALVLTLGLTGPANAQESGASLSAEVGIDNWVEGNAPMVLHATVNAQILITGTLEVVYGGATTHVPVDVPAGSSKTYDIPMRSAFGTGSIRVNLLDEDDERVATQSVRPAVADDELLVAVVADESVFDVLATVGSAFDGISVEPVLADGSIPAAEAGAFAYVVDADPTAETWQYVSDGGRLVTSAGAMTSAPMALDPVGTVPGTAVAWYTTSQHGEVLVLDDIASGDDWRRVLRPGPLELIPSGQWGTAESSLLQSASSSGDGGLASIPWLPFGMLAYLVIIGPANLFVLKRIGRRELAWITIPVLALASVGAFWIAGRQRLEGYSVRHATIAVSDDQPYRRSLLILAAGNEGEYSVSVPGSSAYAVSDVSSAWDGNPGSTSAGFVDASGVAWDLPQLGVGAVEAWGSGDGSLEATLGVNGAVTVTNRTGAMVDHWGAVVNGQVYVSRQSIEAGQASTLEQDNRFAGWQGASFGDAVVETKQIWDETGWQVIAPLGYAASSEIGTSSYAFGITAESAMDAVVNGTDTSVHGPTVWVTPLATSDESNRASGTIVGVGDFSTIEVGQGSTWIETDHLLVSFSTSTTPSEVWITDSDQAWGPLGKLEAWNWTRGSFEEVAADDRLASDSYVSPTGEVLVRMYRNDQQGEPPHAEWLTLAWDGGA